MSALDKLKNKAEEVKGEAKEEYGERTGDEEMQADGQADQFSSDVKDVGEKIKDKLPK